MRLAGYASRTEPVSRVLDEIEISAVLLECPAQRCLIFSFDLMIVGSELKHMIEAKLARHAFEPDEIVLLASHTHFAPATDRACARLGVPEDEFVSDLAAAAEGLLLDMLQQEPSELRMEILQGQLDHSINRRRYWPFPTLGRTYGFRLSSVSMAPDPEGPRDELATVLLLRRAEDNEVIGIIWHYSCHPTAVIPSNVISSDYPGVVRRALRKRFGEIPCVFAQGFCGDIRPNMRPSRQGFRDRLGRFVRTLISGPTFPTPDAEEWARWSESLAARVVDILQRSPGKVCSPSDVKTGSGSIPLSDFFEGSAPDKQLIAEVVRFGGVLEFVMLSAEATIGWQDIIDSEIPPLNGMIRLHTGYLGALFGYLPTADQIRQGGYEVEGFQPLFGLSGKFDSMKITPVVIGCIKRAFDDLVLAAALT